MRHPLILALLMLSACNGVLDDIYDNPTDIVAEGLPYGYKAVDDDGKGGTLFFNSTSYLRWTYFDLGSLCSDTIDFAADITPAALERLEQDRFGDTQNPSAWDIAFHRSVPKTNGGTVAATRFANVGELCAACDAAGGVSSLADKEGLAFIPDEWGDEQVTLDLSDMLNGNVVYLPSLYNPVLNTWLDIDLTSPPPIYTMSRRAYILRLADGRHYALSMTNFRNAYNITAWLTIDFRYLP